jgi:uncharacterized integral membrane protein
VGLLRKAFFILIGVIAVVFAVSNRQFATINLWPLPFEATLPLYMIALGATAFGLLVGAAASWLAKEKMWLRARGAERKAGDLQRAVDRAREREAEPPRMPARPALAARVDDE